MLFSFRPEIRESMAIIQQAVGGVVSDPVVSTNDRVRDDPGKGDEPNYGVPGLCNTHERGNPNI